MFSAGAGVGIGAALIAEGIKDALTAINSAWTGEPINWKQWGVEKLISVGTTLLFAGSDALFDAGQALR